MYQEFYGFSEPPFNLTPDSKFLFLSHRHQEALAALMFGVQERKGFIALTGEIGCGKTTLCRAMLSQFDPEKTKTCVVLNSYLTDLELLKTINEGFGLPAASDSKKTLLDTLNDYLIEEFSKGHNIVLIIDEAQNLRPETLEQIRMISNLETETAKLIQMILVGQPELRRTLVMPGLEQLNQRITVRYHIDPLDENEIPDYIKHRLTVAKPQVEVAFSSKAIKMVHHFSRGVPRRINVICDRSLLKGYIQGTFKIDEKIVEQAVMELRGEMPGMVKARSERVTGSEREHGGGGSRFVSRAVAVLALALLIVGLVLLGSWYGNQKMSNRMTSQNRPTAPPSMQPTPMPTQAISSPGTKPEDTPAAKPPTTVTAVPTPPPTPKPSPTPRPTPLPYDDWQTDPDGVLRVRSPQLAEAAAYIALLRQWNIEIDLEPFRRESPARVAQFDMLATVKLLNFDAIATDTFQETLGLNRPVLVHLDKASGWPASTAVITSVKGEIFEVIDPMRGRLNIRRSQIQPHVVRAIVLYQDPDGLQGARPGELSDRVAKLQNWLAREGFDPGPIDAIYGPVTQRAVRLMQAREGLTQTGIVDASTAAFISARLNPLQPRLY